MVVVGAGGATGAAVAAAAGAAAVGAFGAFAESPTKQCLIKAAKPPVGKVQMDLLAETAFRTDAEVIPHKQHPDQQLRSDGRTAGVTVEIRQMPTNVAQINKPINRA